MATIDMTYRGETRSLNLDDLYMSEEEKLEKYTGWLAGEWQENWGKAHPTAWRFGWWLAGQRSGVDEKFVDVDLNWRELVVAKAAGEDDDPVEVDEVGRPLPTGPSSAQEDGTDEPKSEPTNP